MSLVSVMLIEDSGQTSAIAAMRAAIVPFGSLHAAMSDLAVEIADARPVNSPDVSKLLSLAFGYPGDNCNGREHGGAQIKRLEFCFPQSHEHSNVEFHPSGVTFITPTSSTRISVYKFKTGWTVKVVFPQGSESRAFEIYQALKNWDIRDKEGRALTLKDGAWQ